MPYTTSGGSCHSNSGSSSSSTHQSNNTQYSSLINGPSITTASIAYPSTFNTRLPINSNSIHHAVMSNDGLYAHTTIASNNHNNGHTVIGNQVHHVNGLLPSVNTFNSHHDGGDSVYGIYGTRAATLRHLPSRLDFNSSRNDPINGSIKSKY